MLREERELQRAFSIKEKYEKILANLDDLKVEESVPDDLFDSMKAEYQQSLKQAIETIAQVKRKLAGDIQSEEINVQRQNQELHNLDTRFKVGEITADNLQKAEQRIRRKIQRSQAHLEELKRLQASQSSADVGGYIETKTGRGAGRASLAGSSSSTVSLPSMGNVFDAIRGTSMTDFTEFRTDLSEIKESPLDLIGSVGGLVLFISIFLPWFSISFIRYSQSLMDLARLDGGAGLLILIAIEVIAAIVVIGSTFLAWENARGTTLMVVGVITFVIAVILIPAHVAFAPVAPMAASVIKYSSGYYINIIASLIMLAGGMMTLGK